ncbi:hypothetical protein C8A03DRAFT_37141 [Achaetomium macrosporum]|uniref:Zn(2)-C6 fungal-type domain-containing protein n=1 Tax=Achaetomium macrosporum TaxID=79813 RepID=A0AAN7C476_9PEZI|nr:hypothetical protein C8A03DRAFT_37141 [Achaetomium macrosporum]
MAQPPEAAPLRPQSFLEPAPVQPRVQSNLDALVEQKHQYQPLYRPPQQQQGELRENPPAAGTLQASDAPATGSLGTHSIDNRAGRSPVAVDGKTRADALSTVNASSNSRASVALPADPATGIHGVRTETQHNGGTPAPTVPGMSNTQPPPGAAGQPVTYASPAAYAPAGIPPVSQYVYPPQSIPSADPYRPNPTALPSMRTLDHRQPQGQPQHALPLGAHMGAPMTPAPAPAHMGYYSVHPHPVYGLPDPNAMRFAIPPSLAHDPRISLSGGRHKKEIKRRTKTGCLTCRKRRIKCDEAHPTCNNCKKSKRECLGYDPIFKQQQGPAAIQPAPNAQPTAAPATVLPPATAPPSTAHTYQASYPPPLPSNIASNPAPSSARQSVKHEPGYDYSAAIDPALQGADTTGAAGPRAPRYQQNNVVGGAGQGAVGSNHLRGGTPSSPSTFPPAAEMLDEITKLYREVYVPGLTLFFETRWFDFEKNRATATDPAAMLRNNQSLVSLFASFVQTISKIKSTDPVDMVHSGHLETSVIWSLARLPVVVNVAQPQRYPESAPAEDDPWEARGRVQVFEALITGETLAGNPLSPPPAGNIHPLRKNELEFWYQLAKYLLQDHASASPADTSARERCLGVMRSLLDGRENRDVLYSIAVLREYTAHWDAARNEQSVPSHLEESDPRSKLAVATRFIRDESASTGGTTNVVRRFAELAYCAFIRPGVNVDRTRARS